MTVILELINRQSSSKHRIFPLPLLFIHGANAGAWVWDIHFLSFFAHYGYDAYALSLRGHGSSTGTEMLRWASLADYTADVSQIVYQLGGKVILIGHSMGATIVLKYLKSKCTPAVVLIAPVPVYGLLRASILLAWRDPTLFWDLSLVNFLGPEAGSYSIFRRALFANSTPDSLIRPYFAHMQAESPQAIIEMMELTLPQKIGYVTNGHRATVPLLICGADQDSLFPKWMVQETAQMLGTTASFFHMGHAMMLEPNWKELAAHIHQWLQGLKISHRNAANKEKEKSYF